MWLTVLLGILLGASTTAVMAIYHLGGKSGEADCYIGVSFCGDTVAEAKLLIDRVKSYTNLFILQSGPISKSEIATNEICDYAVDAGLGIIVFFGDLTPIYLEEGLLWRLSWLNTTQQRWGNQFLGIYYYDEPGGIQVDYNWTDHNMRHWNYTYDKPDLDEIANLFNWGFKVDQGFKVAKEGSPALFVSDYALYWWDYLNGYDVVLAQVG